MTKKKAMVPRKIGETSLTLKQRRWVKFFLKSGNATEAAMKAYDCKDRVSAGSIGYENLKKLQEPVRLLMEHKGLSLGRLLETLDDGLKAEKPTKTGEMIEDHPTRHKFMQTAAKWLGIEKKSPEQMSVSQTNYFFDISPEERAEFNQRFSDFVRSEAFETQGIVAEGKKEGQSR